jgi:hypothetical protein
MMNGVNGATPVAQILRSWSYRVQLVIGGAVVIFTAVMTRNPLLTAVVSVPLLIRLGLLAAAWLYQGRETA